MCVCVCVCVFVCLCQRKRSLFAIQTMYMKINILEKVIKAGAINNMSIGQATSSKLELL